MIAMTTANQAGVKLSDSDIATVVEVIREAVQQAVDEANRDNSDNEMRSAVRREIQRFMRQIGVGNPNWQRHQTF